MRFSCYHISLTFQLDSINVVVS